jgi:hypothetical protein
MAAATFADVQYELERLYRTKGYIADLSMKYDPFFAMMKKKGIKTIGGQADMVPVSFDGSGVPSNVEGISGTATPSQGVQFAVTPVQLTNLASISAKAAAGGSGNVGAIVKPLKREIDQAIRKVGKHAAIQLWKNGFPALGQVTVDGSTTVTMINATGGTNHDDIVKLSVGDIVVFAAAQSSGALRNITTGQLTVLKVNQNAGTFVASAAGNGEAVSNDFIFLKNTRNTGATVIAISGVEAWLPATGGTLFGVDCTVDDRLIGMIQSSSAMDIEGAFIDGIGRCLTYSNNGAEDIIAFMHPTVWTTLAKAMQSKTVAISPTTRKGRVGDITFSGWKVSTPNGTIDVFTSMFCPQAKIFMLNMTTWELVGWGVSFPSIVATGLGAAPPIFLDPATGNISCMVGGFPQLECNSPGWNLTISLT